MAKMRMRLLVLLAAVVVSASPASTEASQATATAADRPSGALWFDERAAATLTVDDGRFTDGLGREVVLRGYNVSGGTELDENGGMPFASVADAEKSAAAMRRLGGANTARFLLSWAYAEPVRGHVDERCLAAVTDQLRAFLRAGIRVYPDFHQDLYSRHLFHEGSWYTGDGAPAWAVAQGNYPRESCGVCLFWGQNITQNKAVTQAAYDFWHNRSGVQDAFLTTARTVMEYLAEHLTPGEFAGIAGFDPYNEPHAGTYEPGRSSRAWERDLLWPFYELRAARAELTQWAGGAG